MQDEVPDEERLKALDERVAVLERLVLRLTAPGNHAVAVQNSKRQRLTAGQAVLQVMTDNDRALTTLEIEVMARRLLGRPLSKQSTKRYLADLVRSNVVERVGRDLYSLADQVIR